MKSITTIHHDLPLTVSIRIVKSVLGSLNFSAIAQARSHIRWDQIDAGSLIAETRGYKRPVREDERCIDDAADARNAVEEAHFRDTEVATGMGFAIDMKAGEQAAVLMELRNYFMAFIEQHATSVRDRSLTIAETVQFMMNRPSVNNDAKLEALAEALELDAQQLKDHQVKLAHDDVTDLKANAGKIITFLEKFETWNTDGAGVPAPTCDLDELDIEKLFDTLPAHVQYKVMYAAMRAHEKATARSLTDVLRGKLDAAGDIKMLKASQAEIHAWLTTFMIVKRADLDAYMERGGSLPILEDRTIVTASTVVTKRDTPISARGARSQDAAAAAQARADEDAAIAAQVAAAKTKPQMRRAPAPAKA